MNVEQRAIIESAEREGLLPMERCARLVVHDMVKITRAQMARYEVGYNKMTEKQQDAVISDLEAAYKELALTTARTIASGGTPSVIMTLKSMKIDSKSQITGTVEGNEKHFNELISKAQDKSEVVLVLYERQYADAMDDIQSDKDQKSLPLDGDKPAKKPRAKKDDKKEIEIAPKMLNDARDFVVIQQNASVAGLQNLLKIGYEKAIAILKTLEGEGLVTWVGTDETGQYELVRNKQAPADDKPVFDEATLEVFYATAVKAVLKAGSADDSVLTAIYGDDDNAIEVALMRMQDDGIVSEPSADGLRAVLTIPA